MSRLVLLPCSLDGCPMFASAYMGRKRWGAAPSTLTCLGCFSSKLPQKRHPERSASQIYRVTPHLVARSRRTPAVLILPMLLGPFRPPKPENRICCGTHLIV